MADLEAHCFPPATIFSEGGVIWGLVSPFPPSSCYSSTPVLASYGAEHVLVGVMVDLEAHCFPPATIFSEGGVIWGLVSPFPPSSCYSSTPVLASYGADLGGLVFLLL